MEADAIARPLRPGQEREARRTSFRCLIFLLGGSVSWLAFAQLSQPLLGLVVHSRRSLSTRMPAHACYL